MDLLELRHALGSAYARAHVLADRHGAVAMLKETFAEPGAKAAAQAYAEKVAGVVRARSQGARSGCYVTKFTHDLLTEALCDV